MAFAKHIEEQQTIKALNNDQLLLSHDALCTKNNSLIYHNSIRLCLSVTLLSREPCLQIGSVNARLSHNCTFWHNKSASRLSQRMH